MTQRTRKKNELDDFVVNDDDLNADEPWSSLPRHVIELPSSLRDDQQSQDAASSPVSSQNSDARIYGASARVSYPRSGTILVPETDPVEPIMDATPRTRPPLRDAAVNAGSPMRIQARIDLGHISDLANAYDSDDEDELDADGDEFAPFATQMSAQGSEEVSEIPEFEDVGAIEHAEICSSARFAEIAFTIDAHGFMALIDEARIAENAAGTKFGEFYFEEGRDYWTELCLITLCSMPEKVVRELVCGNLKQAYDSDAELRERLDSFENRAKKQPSIYARSLTKTDGDLMTIDQARRLAKWLLRYVSTSNAIEDHPTCIEAFRRVDSEFRGQWKRANPQAPRAYLATKTSDRLERRVENVRIFCTMLLAECDACEAEARALKPLLYIGYAARADRRKRQHEACGKSSNWLATLTQAMCNVLWGRGHFKMHFMVVCLLCEQQQGAVAEMLLTRISGAYYTVGGGFCIDVAGKSLESLHFKEVTTMQRSELWDEFRAWIDQNTPMDENVEIQIKRNKLFVEHQAETNRLRIQEAEETTMAHLQAMKTCYLMCKKYEAEPEFQSVDMRKNVHDAYEAWKQLKERFPDYARAAEKELPDI